MDTIFSIGSQGQASKVLLKDKCLLLVKTGDETFFSSIFTIKMKNQLKRVYRVDSLTVDDEGYVDVTGTHQKLYDVFGDKKDGGNVVVDGNGDPVREVIGSALATINLDLDQFLPSSDDPD